MHIIADLHIHSRFSRATSKNMNVADLDFWARKKGVTVLGTGDFTHPKWLEELEENLEPAEEGLYKRKDLSALANAPAGEAGTRFMLTVEISAIYSKGGKVRKVHTLLFAPSFEVVKKINGELRKIGNLHSDGRPILGIDVKELAKIAFDASPDCMVVPAHAWTPWFSVFGSQSGFDSLDECFEELTPYIHAIETGLSSDPAMNWRVSALDRVALISNSDCHSSPKIGREANVFDAELSYNGIIGAIKAKDPKRFLYTIEFFPEEGKYHYDGHKDCKVSMKPAFAPPSPKASAGRSKASAGKPAERQTREVRPCPVCGRPLTIGVLSRVEELADRPDGYVPKNSIPYKNLIPLQEIIADVYHVGAQSKRVQKEYEKLLAALGGELTILLQIPENELKKATTLEVAEGIVRVRQGKVVVEPGYDGVYGKIHIFKEGEEPKSQKALF